jgi:hypothetical protein
MRHRRRWSILLHSLLRHPWSRCGTTIADWRYADAACFSSWLRMLMLDASKSIAGAAASPKLPPPLPGPASASTSRRLVYSTPPLLPLLLQLDGRDRMAARGGGGASSSARSMHDPRSFKTNDSRGNGGDETVISWWYSLLFMSKTKLDVDTIRMKQQR